MAKQPKPEPDGDESLWRAVTADIAPLKHPAAAVAPEPPGKKPAKQAKAVAKPAPATPAPKPPDLPPLEPGRAAGVDKRTAQRLRRGQLAIEARLDLHGQTQDEAHRRLVHFLAEAYDTGLRNLLIITGKGRVTEQGAVAQFTRETETVLIDVDGNREELITSLAARGVTAVVDGVSLAVELENDDQYDAIRDSLVETNARLRRMAPRRHHLTDIFRDSG